MRKFWLVLIGGLLSANAVVAQDLDLHPTGDHVDTNHGTVSAELGLGGGSEGFGYAPRILGTYRWSDSFLLDASINTAGGVVTPGAGSSEGSFRIANPYIGGNYIFQAGAMWLTIGGGIALPLATYRKDTPVDIAVDQATLYIAAAMHGLWDMHLWAPNNWSIVVPGHLTMPIASMFFEADASFILLIPTDGVVMNTTQLYIQAAATLRYPLTSAVDIGGRLQAVWDTNGNSNLDNFQTAIEPFARLHSDQYFVQGGLMLNLDSPNGPSFTNHHVFGLLFSGGMQY